ncbi:MAG: PAS domain-containing protein [Acidobacteriaceae bacterium]
MASDQPSSAPRARGLDGAHSTGKIKGAGEMADLIRAHNWAGTPLGALDAWPGDLFVRLNAMLASRFPMAVAWGPEMVQFYNDAYRPLFAEKHPGALGQTAAETWKEAWHIVGPELEAVLVHGESTYHENVLIPVMREGRLQDVYWTYSNSPIYAPSGEIAGILSVSHDVTAQRRAGEAAREAARRQDAIYNTSLEYIGLLSKEGRLLDCNRASLEFAGNTREELLGRYFWDCDWFTHTPGAREAIREAVARAAKGEQVRHERTFLRPSGEALAFDFSISPVRDASGDVIFLVPEARDVTLMKRTEATLKESEKLAAVGRLAASIAHEVNNPLEAVTNLLYLAMGTGDAELIRRYLQDADRELHRVSLISNQTLLFYRQSTNPRFVRSDELIESAIASHQGRILNAEIQVEPRLRARALLNCFDGEIRQVLNNLIGNAIEAMGGGGRLRVRSREGTQWRSGRKGLVLTVADTGHGIDRENLTKVFEPFFSTKKAGGTGLGLWVSQEIVVRHLGSLRVRSSKRVGRSGTVFMLFLPFDGVTREKAA